MAVGLVVAVPGVALAVPGEPGQCSGTGYCQNIDPPDNGTLDGAGVVVQHGTELDGFISTLVHNLRGIWG